MTTTANRIFVNGNAHVWIGAVGTTVPATPTGPFTNFNEVGFFTNDSLNFSTDPNFEVVNSHQDDFPVRRMQTSDDATLAVDLQEWSGDNFRYAYGGGTISETTPGSNIWKFEPPLLGQRVERMALVQCKDGTKNAMLVIPRCLQLSGVEQDLSKATESKLPLRLGILGSGGVTPWYWVFDDASAFSGAAPTLTSRTPTSGVAAGGVPVDLVGTGLGAVSAVLFGKSGTATSATSTTLTNSGATYTTNAFAGYTVEITGGTGVGQTRTVASNTATALTVSVAWTTTPDTTSTYRVYRAAQSFFANPAGTQMSVYAPAGVAGQTVDLILIHSVSTTPVVGANYWAFT